tara:strand:+ start:491 stop:1042 length:552 start_codon:yes stop_codon:yes gene_type:complete
MGKSFMEGLSDFTSNITSSVVTDPEELAELNEIWNAADQNEKIFASVDDNTVGDSTDSLDNLISDKGFLKEKYEEKGYKRRFNEETQEFEFVKAEPLDTKKLEEGATKLAEFTPAKMLPGSRSPSVRLPGSPGPSYKSVGLLSKPNPLGYQTTGNLTQNAIDLSGTLNRLTIRKPPSPYSTLV